jgi:FdrA protein
VLLDVVIGLGAHEDPAGHVALVVSERGAGGPMVIASVTGTDGDPQGRLAQIEKLRTAGIHVAASNADAAELAVACIGAGV